MPQLRLVPEELVVTSFLPVSATLGSDGAAVTRPFPQTCQIQSCVAACASNTCPLVCDP